MSEEGPKVVTIVGDRGPVLISADVHGNREDFHRLRDVFLASEARGEAPLWISVGDWVHGPSDERHPVTDSEGQPLYAYADETPAILDELFALMDRYPAQVLSITGNHEHAHIGGMRTGKFHRDEAAFLESHLTPVQIDEMYRRFRAWPMIIRLAPCGVVVTHGAPAPGTVADFERIRYAGNDDPATMELARAAMTRYGFGDGDDVQLLAQLSDEHSYQILLHGHDREETGFSENGPRALLLCTSFGARRALKTYAWLDRARRYESLADLRLNEELRRLYP